mgnify:CR=1 FL=1
MLARNNVLNMKTTGGVVLLAQVTSKGGTTERALGEMERASLGGRFIDAVKAARERSRELGEQFGRD